MPTSSPSWVSIQHAADYYSVSTQTIRRWIANGDLRAKRIGPQLVRVDMASLAALGRALGKRAAA